jgi:uncharacterized protein (TIGR02147 family)
MIDHSKESLDKFPKDTRHVSGLTMGISRAAYAVLAEEIEAFKDRAKAIVNRDDESSRVYQMTVALFPVSAPTPPFGNEKSGGQS